MAKRPTRSSVDAAPSDEALQFRAAVSDVKPLAHPPTPPGLSGTAPRRRPQRPARTHSLEEAMPLIAALPAAPGADAPGADAPGEPRAGAGAAEVLSFQRAGVRTQVMRRLRRGQIAIEDELDLHGLQQIAARERLAEFLAHSRDAGRRCVRVIHGKGYRSGARGPVLKTAVDLWLRRHHDVMAFTSARAIDGGTGALYVLLRA
jgi:DNA-nicking Smr family endonuclease